MSTNRSSISSPFDMSEMDIDADQCGSQHPRYKTEMCRNMKISGICKYGTNCQYAHSVSELKVKNRPAKYKTDYCDKWKQSGSCPYGSRCLYIHDETPIEVLTLQQKLADERQVKKREPSGDEMLHMGYWDARSTPTEQLSCASPPLASMQSGFLSSDLPLAPSFSPVQSDTGSLNSFNFDQSKFSFDPLVNQEFIPSDFSLFTAEKTEMDCSCEDPLNTSARFQTRDKPTDIMQLFSWSNEIEKCTSDLFNQKN